MKQLLSLILVFSIFIVPSRAHGEDKKLISPLRAGQAAPYDGVLLSNAAAADWIGEMKAERARAEAFLAQQLALAEERRVNDLKSLQISADAAAQSCDLQVAGLKRDIKVLQDGATSAPQQTSSSVSPYVWTGLGAAGGVLLTLATVFAVGAARR